MRGYSVNDLIRELEREVRNGRGRYDVFVTTDGKRIDEHQAIVVDYDEEVDAILIDTIHDESLDE